MRLTDQHILTVMADLGPATLTQIVTECITRWPEQDRVPARIRPMMASLVRFKFVEFVDVGPLRYYYLEGTQPNIEFKRTYRARVSEFLTAQAPRAYTAQEIADNLGITRAQVARVLEDAGPQIKRISAKPTHPMRYYLEVARC